MKKSVRQSPPASYLHEQSCAAHIDLATVPAMKRCSKCGVAKDAGAFFKRRAAKDGLQPHCKPCQKAMQEERSKGDGWKASAKRWRADNRERDREHKRQWVSRNLGYFRDKAAAQCEELAPNYVRAAMRKSVPGLRDIPRDLLEADTQRRRLKRLIKEISDGQH